MIRVTIELNEVTVAGVKYMSNYAQRDIDKATPYWSDETERWEHVECLACLRTATEGEMWDANEYVFIKCPCGESIIPLWERILNRFGHAKIEEVKVLSF